MLKYYLIIGLLLIHTSSFAGIINILDNDAAPVKGCAVFAQNGAIIGISDGNGQVEVSNISDYPVSMRCLGFEEKEIISALDTVYLVPKSYELGEIEVSINDRPVTRLECYMRMYASEYTSTDTIKEFTECMGNFFLTRNKEKKLQWRSASPKLSAVKRHTHYTSSSGLDSVSRSDESLTWPNLITLSPRPIKETEPMLKGASVDYVPGKYGTYEVLRKTNQTFTVSCDVLANEKKHKWTAPLILRLFGMNLEFTKFNCAMAFAANENAIYSPEDILYATFSIEGVEKGKVFKKAKNINENIILHNYIEIYPIEVTYLTVEEANNVINSRGRTELRVSSVAPPLSKATTELIEKVKDKEVNNKK